MYHGPASAELAKLQGRPEIERGMAEASLVSCRSCGRANPAARRFCGGCGQPLWEACPKCGVECAADERYCGACGSDIQSHRDQQRREQQQQLDAAMALAAEHRYEAAIAALRLLPDEEANERIARLDAELKQHVAAAAAALDRARASLETHDYRAAQAAIERVPQPMRGEEHERLLERARACRRELAELLAEIRAGLEQKQTPGLLAKLDRLLVLKPDHEQARKLAGQLCEKVHEAAKVRLDQRQYCESLELLEQVPAQLRGDEFAALFDAARERQALLAAIRGAAHADETLLGLAQRLCQLSPGDAEAARLRDQVAQRLRQRPADPSLAAVAWSPAAKSVSPAIPIDWLAHLMRPMRDAATSQRLHEQPGQYFAALGLALQGVGLAAIDMELTPQDGGGVLSRLPLGFARSASSAWGIDLGNCGLRAIKLARDKGDAARVETFECIDHSRPLALIDAAEERSAAVLQTLREFAARAGDLKQTKVCIGMPGLRTLARFFELPPMPAKKVADAAALETRRQLPIALDDLCWSLRSFDAPSKPDQHSRRVLVQASRRAHVRERIALFQEAGLRADVVQSDCLALHNALAYEFFAGQDATAQSSQAIAAIDLGADATNVVVSGTHGVWFRTLGLGGEAFKRALAEEFRATAAQAERLKRQPAKAPRFHRWQEALESVFDQLSGELERSLLAYAKVHPDQPVRRVYGLGGAMRTFGLLEHLRGGW